MPGGQHGTQPKHSAAASCACQQASPNFILQIPQAVSARSEAQVPAQQRMLGPGRASCITRKQVQARTHRALLAACL